MNKKVRVVNLSEIKDNQQIVEYENVEKYGYKASILFQKNQRLIYINKQNT